MLKESLHQKPRDVCIIEDTESIDLGRFENTKLNSVRKRDSMFVTGWRSRLGITGHVSVDDSKKGSVVKRWHEVTDAEAEEDETRIL